MAAAGISAPQGQGGGGEEDKDEDVGMNGAEAATLGATVAATATAAALFDGSIFGAGGAGGGVGAASQQSVAQTKPVRTSRLIKGMRKNARTSLSLQTQGAPDLAAMLGGVLDKRGLTAGFTSELGKDIAEMKDKMTKHDSRLDGLEEIQKKQQEELREVKDRLNGVPSLVSGGDSGGRGGGSIAGTSTAVSRGEKDFAPEFIIVQGFTEFLEFKQLEQGQRMPPRAGATRMEVDAWVELLKERLKAEKLDELVASIAEVEPSGLRSWKFSIWTTKPKELHGVVRDILDEEGNKEDSKFKLCTKVPRVMLQRSPEADRTAKLVGVAMAGIRNFMKGRGHKGFCRCDWVLDMVYFRIDGEAEHCWASILSGVGGAKRLKWEEHILSKYGTTEAEVLGAARGR